VEKKGKYTFKSMQINMLRINGLAKKLGAVEVEISRIAGTEISALPTFATHDFHFRMPFKIINQACRNDGALFDHRKSGWYILPYNRHQQGIMSTGKKQRINGRILIEQMTDMFLYKEMGAG
jgi:hypothetical protein